MCELKLSVWLHSCLLYLNSFVVLVGLALAGGVLGRGPWRGIWKYIGRVLEGIGKLFGGVLEGVLEGVLGRGRGGVY